jgi:hypothetical protein
MAYTDAISTSVKHLWLASLTKLYYRNDQEHKWNTGKTLTLEQTLEVDLKKVKALKSLVKTSDIGLKPRI